MRETGDQFLQGKMKARTAEMLAGNGNMTTGEDGTR
jgi:hypothetical protein